MGAKALVATISPTGRGAAYRDHWSGGGDALGLIPAHISPSTSAHGIAGGPGATALGLEHGGARNDHANMSFCEGLPR